MAKGRWAYMAAPGFNPPNNDCPECAEPSKTYHIGDKTVDGVPQQRWRCQHGHEWIIRPVQAAPSQA
jgi:hypothetical protein